MPVDRTQYSTAFEVPDLLQRDIAGRLTCPVYLDGAIVAPSAATLTLRKPDGSELIAASAGTIVSSTAGYTIAAATIEDEPFQMGYRAEWALTISGVVHSFRNEVGIVRFAPWCPISDRDLLKRHTGLARSLRTGETTFQDYIDEAWNQLQRWLIQKGNRPHLILQSTDLKDLATVWALVVVFKDWATNATTEDRNFRLRNEYIEELEKLKNTLNLTYSANDDTTPDTRKRSTSPVTFLGTHGGRDGYYSRWPR